mgnify:CR=1 FL=1
MTKFSVCIPFLKNECYLRELLGSVENISGVDMEVLVSQDAPVSNDLKQHFKDRLAIRWVTGPTAGSATTATTPLVTRRMRVRSRQPNA